MAERSPNTNKAEHEADYSTYSGIAADFFDRYVGDATPPNVEDVDAWRNQTRNEIADHMAGIARDMPQEERVKAYAEIIDVLKALRGYTGAASAEMSVEDDTEQKTGGAMGANAKIAAMTILPHLTPAGLVQLGKRKLAAFSEKHFSRKDGETEESYNRRRRLVKVGAVVGGLALAGAALVVGKEYADSIAGDGLVDTTPEATQDTPQAEAGFGESDYREGGAAQEADMDIPQTYEQSIQAERDFLAENGRINNDFNHIDQFADKESIMGELHEQYTKSPTELSGQLYQIQGIEGVVEAIPDHLRVLDGESYEQYTARLSEALHRDPALHDILADYTTGYVSERYNVLDMPEYYQAAYIDAEGNSYWDSNVSSSDPNDKIIMLAEGKGIRLPCGQPVELIYIKEGVTHGIGGAPIPTQDFSYIPQPTLDTPGVGGPPPTSEVPLVNPPTSEQPPVEQPPVEEPPVPGVEKDWSKVPDLDGLTQLPLDETVTPRTEMPTIGDNGTSSPDFVPGVEGSTPGADTGPSVSAPEAVTPTIDTSNNAVETGANATDSTGNSIPDGAFDDSNL